MSPYAVYDGVCGQQTWALILCACVMEHIVSRKVARHVKKRRRDVLLPVKAQAGAFTLCAMFVDCFCRKWPTSQTNHR